MPLLRAEVIVLHAWDLGEHDRLVDFYTRDHGKVRGRRARRAAAPLALSGALELFTWGDAFGFEREGRGLVRLDHFDIREPFRRVRDDLECLGQGARMIEAVARLTAERDAQPLCFALLVRGLRALEAGASPARVQLAFALRLLDLLGHRPRLDRCGRCGRPVGTEGILFDATEGYVVCERCRGTGASLARRWRPRCGAFRRRRGRRGSAPGSRPLSSRRPPPCWTTISRR